MKREQGHPLYWLVRGLVKLWALIYLRFETIGTEHIPDMGGCVLTPNHASFLDPPLVGVGVRKRVVHFLARASLFRFPIMGWWYRRIGTIPIEQDRGDLAALRSALKELQSGKVVCLFPEGSRSPDGELQTPKGGVGFLIAKAKVPVVPVYVDGTFRAWPRGGRWIKPVKVRVFYGPPIAPDEFTNRMGGKINHNETVRTVMSHLAELKEQAEKYNNKS